MLSIYTTALGFALRNLIFVLSFTGLFIALPALSSYAGTRVDGTTLAQFFLIFALHRAMLFGETAIFQQNKSATARPVWIGRFIALCFAMVVLTGIITLIGLLLYDMATGWQSTVDSRLGPLTIGFLLCYGVVFGLCGALLSGIAAADPTPFGTQLRRSLSVAPRILLGLLVGPGLFYVVRFLALEHVMPGSYNDDAPFYVAGRGFDTAAMVTAIPLILTNVFASILTVTVLCSAYKRIAPDEVLAVTTDGQAKSEVFS